MNAACRAGVFGPSGAAHEKAKSLGLAANRHVVSLTRFEGDRARLQLGPKAQLALRPQVGETLQIEITWPNGMLAVNVVITAVHRDGFVDVAGVVIDGKPRQVRLCRYPEIKRLP